MLNALFRPPEVTNSHGTTQAESHPQTTRRSRRHLTPTTSTTPIARSGSTMVGSVPQRPEGTPLLQQCHLGGEGPTHRGAARLAPLPSLLNYLYIVPTSQDERVAQLLSRHVHGQWDPLRSLRGMEGRGKAACGLVHGL
jgi:hypothetical protein